MALDLSVKCLIFKTSEIYPRNLSSYESHNNVNFLYMWYLKNVSYIEEYNDI